MQHCEATPGEVSHYADMFTTVTTVHALTNCEMYVLEHDDFRECVQDFPIICNQLHAAALRYIQCMLSLLHALWIDAECSWQ